MSAISITNPPRLCPRRSRTCRAPVFNAAQGLTLVLAAATFITTSNAAAVPAPAPSTTADICTIRTIVDCIYNYQDVPRNGADCMKKYPIPVLPASCAPGATTPQSSAPTNAPYHDIKCDGSNGGNVDITSDLVPGPDRWNHADADDAWKDAIAYVNDFRKHNSSDIHNPQFSQIIADFFHATGSRQCMNVPDTNCDTTIPCGQKGGTGVTSPAAYMIVNSMASLHLAVDAMDTALKAAYNDFTADSSDIAKAFSNIGSTKAFKLTMDAIGLAFALTAAPSWNSWLKRIPAIDNNKNFAGTAKDGLAGLVTGGVNFAKDSSSDPTTFEAAADFSNAAGKLIQAMRQTNFNQANILFDGTNQTTIGQLMLGGGSAGLQTPDPYTVEQAITKALIVITIPLAWSEDGSEHSPFIMNGNGRGTGCDLSKLDMKGILDDDTSKATFVCVNNNPYWLLFAKRPCAVTGHEMRCPDPDYQQFWKPNGIDTLDGNNFKGLKRDDLVISAVNAYVNNGNKNGVPYPPDPNNLATIWDIANNGVQAAGIFSVPICSYEEALVELSGGHSPNHPCP